MQGRSARGCCKGIETQCLWPAQYTELGSLAHSRKEGKSKARLHEAIEGKLRHSTWWNQVPQLAAQEGSHCTILKRQGLSIRSSEVKKECRSCQVQLALGGRGARMSVPWRLPSNLQPSCNPPVLRRLMDRPGYSAQTASPCSAASRRSNDGNRQEGSAAGSSQANVSSGGKRKKVRPSDMVRCTGLEATLAVHCNVQPRQRCRLYTTSPAEGTSSAPASATVLNLPVAPCPAALSLLTNPEHSSCPFDQSALKLGQPPLPSNLPKTLSTHDCAAAAGRSVSPLAARHHHPHGHP